jgi:hypothetical protein
MHSGLVGSVHQRCLSMHFSYVTILEGKRKGPQMQKTDLGLSMSYVMLSLLNIKTLWLWSSPFYKGGNRTWEVKKPTQDSK